ncbi:ABC transporter ATP-binding protein [Mesorhizobium sp. B2-4-15]|uniref:ABC transporter ATP-binding protein n=1 Tax=Mesorhizobium sp. B2-4-15 TaxID=2589934 RepID=UPI00114FF3A1|nr:ABC transporter ATP-binding protein [Mesorhizobium sp. B2-4-15]TPK73610.1 ABC transporter ATP-binding protein [Mesorhizobium sp. B2-4-15]
MTVPVSLIGISKAFGSFKALDAVDLDVKAGEFVTLLGPSGSGKSSLLMAIAGFLQPDAGEIRIGDKNIVGVPANQRNIGVVFQSYALFPHMSVRENVAFPLRVRGVSRTEMAKRSERALQMVQLAGLGDRRISELSGGQRQRVALARAIVFEPSIMLLDEPLSALDKNLREQMQIELRDLHKALGLTMIYVTHDQREALTLSDRIAVVNGGKIVQVGTPISIYTRPTSTFVAEFLGEAILLPIADAKDIVPQSMRPSGSVSQLMLRAEDLRIGSAPQGAAALCGIVRQCVFQGDSWLLEVNLPNSPSPMRVRAQQADDQAMSRLTNGDSIDLFVSHDRMHFL